MPNMAHCRFSNTLEDLRECFDHMDDPTVQGEEQRSRTRLIALCKRIAEDYGDE